MDIAVIAGFDHETYDVITVCRQREFVGHKADGGRGFDVYRQNIVVARVTEIIGVIAAEIVCFIVRRSVFSHYAEQHVGCRVRRVNITAVRFVSREAD